MTKRAIELVAGNNKPTVNVIHSANNKLKRNIINKKEYNEIIKCHQTYVKMVAS